MLRHLLFVLSLAPAFAAAHADTSYDEADCAFFEHADRQGASWTAAVNGKDPYSATLTNWWQDRASSVWVRPGFVLEAYTEQAFQGTRLDVSSDLATASAGGYSVNLDAFGFNDQVSSYRCRPAGQIKTLSRGTVLWLEAVPYSWLSGGNHPDHKTLDMRTEGQDLIVRVHADHTYGTSRQDYEVNLTQGKVHVEFLSSGLARGVADFDLLLASMRPDFKLTLQELIQHLQILAQGYASYPPRVEPPKPELQSLINYLQIYAP